MYAYRGFEEERFVLHGLTSLLFTSTVKACSLSCLRILHNYPCENPNVRTYCRIGLTCNYIRLTLYTILRNRHAGFTCYLVTHIQTVNSVLYVTCTLELPYRYVYIVTCFTCVKRTSTVNAMCTKYIPLFIVA